MIKQIIAKKILDLMGWKYEILTPNFDKCLLVVAPHTSNWDFLMGKLFYAAVDRDSNFVIKKQWMAWPFGYFIRKMGGIPVDRSKVNRFTDQVADIFKTRKKFNLAITPEGTRERNPKWKKGFYHIAIKAEVPIVLVQVDYKKKYMALFEVFTPTGDEAADMKAIMQKYKGVTAKYPDQFSIGD